MLGQYERQRTEGTAKKSGGKKGLEIRSFTRVSLDKKMKGFSVRQLEKFGGFIVDTAKSIVWFIGTEDLRASNIICWPMQLCIFLFYSSSIFISRSKLEPIWWTKMFKKNERQIFDTGFCARFIIRINYRLDLRFWTGLESKNKTLFDALTASIHRDSDFYYLRAVRGKIKRK